MALRTGYYMPPLIKTDTVTDGDKDNSPAHRNHHRVLFRNVRKGEPPEADALLRESSRV